MKPSVRVAAVSASCLVMLVGDAYAAGPDPATVASMMKWWIETGGPALQKGLGHTGFRAARSAVPAWMENSTDTIIYFTAESQSCNETEHSLNPWQGYELDCETTNGDNWYNIIFDDGQGRLTRLRIDGGTMTYFIWERGRLKLNRYYPDE